MGAIPTEMGAVVVEGPRRASRQWAKTPEWEPEEVLIHVEGCGVCGSSLPVWEGRPWVTYPLPPGSPGHEGWGKIVRVGERVHSAKLGDRVSFLSERAFAEYASAPETALCRIPEALGKAAFPGEALGCLMNIFRRSELQAGQRLAVVGAGFLGIGLVALAARAGVQVTAISRRPWALDRARQLGATHTLQLDSDDAATVRAVQRLTGDDGCERVIEAVGVQRALTLASKLVAARGRLIIAGYHQDGPREVDLQSWNARGIDVINAHERDAATCVAGMRAATDAITRGSLDLNPLVTHRFDLADVAAAFHALEKRPDGFLKAVLTP